MVTPICVLEMGVMRDMDHEISETEIQNSYSSNLFKVSLIRSNLSALIDQLYPHFSHPELRIALGFM
jgi:hypothetical protein